MARVNHKRVKQLIQEKQGKITDQEFFTSRLLAIHLEDLAAAQTRRYGVNRRVRVCLVWQPDRDDLAFTDNLTITLNPGHPAITQFPTRGERYQMVCGLFAHELGHCLYTDFLAQQTYRNSLANGRWYPSPPELYRIRDVKTERELWEYAQKEPENLVLLGRVALGIGNVLEDAVVENKVLEEFPGTLGQALGFVRAWQWREMPTVTQLKELEALGTPMFYSLLQLFLSYGKYGELKYGEEPLSEAHIQTMFELLPLLDQDLQLSDSRMRWNTVNQILICCWEQVRDYLEALKGLWKDSGKQGTVFAQFEARKFLWDRQDGQEARDETRRYLNCDLLILDDLGSELVTRRGGGRNAFSPSAGETGGHPRACRRDINRPAGLRQTGVCPGENRAQAFGGNQSGIGAFGQRRDSPGGLRPGAFQNHGKGDGTAFGKHGGNHRVPGAGAGPPGGTESGGQTHLLWRHPQGGVCKNPPHCGGTAGNGGTV